jgi:hypothetical protein
MAADFTLVNSFAEPEPGNDEREGRRATAELLGQAAKEATAAGALARTIATLRRHPDLPGWYRRDRNTAEDQIVREWLDNPAVQAELNDVKSRRQGRCLDRLLDRAQGFLESEDERLMTAWAYVTGRVDWDSEQPVVRELFDVVHCTAAEQGTAGGPNVRVTCRLAADMIYARTGHKYALKTICWAGHRLEQLGALTRTVKSRRIATVYHLLTDKLRAALATLSTSRKQAPPPLAGLVSEGGSRERKKQEKERPRFSDEEREVFWSTVRRLKNWDHGLNWEPLWVRAARAARRESALVATWRRQAELEQAVFGLVS